MGLVIIASSLLFVATDPTLLNNIVVGAAIFLLAGYNYYRLRSNQLPIVDVLAFVSVLGIWILVSPFVFDVGSVVLVWSNVFTGLGSLIFAAIATNARRVGTPEGEVKI